MKLNPVTEVPKKRKFRMVYSLPLLLAALIISVTGTLAYLTYKTPMEHNKFTFGNVDVKIIEEYNPPRSMDPGNNDYDKKVSIQNTGTIDCFVRVDVMWSSVDVQKISYLSTDNRASWIPATSFTTNTPNKWVYQATGELTGYYYYTEPLAPGETSEPLFTDVRTVFSAKTSDVTNIVNQTERDYDIYIHTEAIQQMALDGSGKHKDYQVAWKDFLAKK